MLFRLAFILLLKSLVLARTVHGQGIEEAVEGGDIGAVRTFLEDSNAANELVNGVATPIFFARDPAMVALLIEHRADLSVREQLGHRTPLENAAEHHFYEVTDRPKWEEIIKQMRDAGAEYTPVCAIYLNDLAFISKQLNDAREVVLEPKRGTISSLRLAVRTGRVEICRLLLAENANPNEATPYPLIADATDNPEILKMLIEKGANVHRRIQVTRKLGGLFTEGGEAAPIHFAVRRGNPECVKILLDSGVDPNAANESGETPLHLALLTEQWERSCGHDTKSYIIIVRDLIASGASTRFRDRFDKSPQDYAKRLGSPFEIQWAMQKQQNAGK